MEEVILVDEADQILGFAEKMQAHRDGGKLHRAFSIFIFDARGRMLLQQRSRDKYHFAGLWSNACCGHPHRDESLDQSAHRRLQEEMGFDAPLRELFTFLYTAQDAQSGLTERELDHVLVGEFTGTPSPAPGEVDEWQWIDSESLRRDLAANPQRYTPWFATVAIRVVESSDDSTGC